MPPNAYLCSGLDIYLSEEPDLMSSMALVHSRIRRVFYKRDNPAYGALYSGRGHIHCLRSLNHHYRVFRLTQQRQEQILTMDGNREGIDDKCS